MTVVEKDSSPVNAAAASGMKFDKFSTSSSATEDDRFMNDVEAGNGKKHVSSTSGEYNDFLEFIGSSEKSKHGISEHSDTRLLPPQIKRSSENSSGAAAGGDDADTNVAAKSSSRVNGEEAGGVVDVSASRRSRMSSSRRASTTEERRNPFAFREGNALIWRNVNMTLKAKNSKQSERKLLNAVWGEVPPGEITAIMGPSGAGKLLVFKFFVRVYLYYSCDFTPAIVCIHIHRQNISA